MSACKQNCDGLVLRILWVALFVVVWRVAELVLLATVLVQLVYRLFRGRPHVEVMNFGDSLSQYLAQMGRFASFHSDEKPWPFADWPAPREPQGEAPFAAAPAPASAPVPAAAGAAASAAVVAPVAIAATDEAAAAEGAQDNAAAAAPQTPAAAAATEASDAPPKAPDGGDAEPRA